MSIDRLFDIWWHSSLLVSAIFLGLALFIVFISGGDCLKYHDKSGARASLVAMSAWLVAPLWPILVVGGVGVGGYFLVRWYARTARVAFAVED